MTQQAAEVLVTGVGLVSGLGDGSATWRALAAGDSALQLWQSPPSVEGLPLLPAAPAEKASPLPFLKNRKLAKYMNASSRMAVVAAGRALEDAGLLDDDSRRKDLALLMTTGLIAFDLTGVCHIIEEAKGGDGDLDLRAVGAEGLRKCNPLLPFKMLLNMPLGLVSIAFGIGGHNFILYPGPGQAGACLEAALRGIRNRRFERALVGATAEGLSLLPLCTMQRLGRLATSVEAAQPFSPNHAGQAPADSAAFVVLESRAAARRRGATGRAVIEHVGLGFAPEATLDQRWQRQVRLWEAATVQAEPEVVLATGCLDHADDQRCLDSFRHAPGLRGGTLLSLDGQLGAQGAAAFPFATALAAEIVHRRKLLPGRLAAGRADVGPSTVLVSASDPDGSGAVCALSRVGSDQA